VAVGVILNITSRDAARLIKKANPGIRRVTYVSINHIERTLNRNGVELVEILPGDMTIEQLVRSKELNKHDMYLVVLDNPETERATHVAIAIKGKLTGKGIVLDNGTCADVASPLIDKYSRRNWKVCLVYRVVSSAIPGDPSRRARYRSTIREVCETYGSDVVSPKLRLGAL